MKPRVTKKEFADVTAERKHLLDVERPTIDQMLSEARREGDLSENADYDSAKRQKIQVEKRIAALNDLLANCEIINNESTEQKVMVGDMVTISYVDSKLPDCKYIITGNTVTVNILGEIKTVNDDCPFAQSVLGHSINEEVIVQTQKPYRIKIIKIER